MNITLKKLVASLTLLTASGLVWAHNDHGAHTPAPANQSVKDAIFALDVFKSPTCGCCTEWIDKLAANKIDTKAYHPADLNELKNELAIRPEYQSCHTAVSKEGFFFEGHVPVYLVKQFLANPPKGAIGLSVPGMPIGSPGMEMGERFHPYSVLVLNEDGTTAIYEEIKTLAQSQR